MSETALMKEIRQAINLDGRIRVVRNNTGFDADRRVRYGLGIGGADLVGLIRGSGRAAAFEVKTEAGRLTAEQQAWLRAFRLFGGFATVVRNRADSLAAVDRACAGASE